MRPLKNKIKCSPCHTSSVKGNLAATHVCLTDTNVPGEKRALEVCRFKVGSQVDDVLIPSNPQMQRVTKP